MCLVSALMLYAHVPNLQGPSESLVRLICHHVVLVQNKRIKMIYVGLIMEKMLLHTTGLGLKFHTQRKHTYIYMSNIPNY
jgi:hypothetical protein